MVKQFAHITVTLMLTAQAVVAQRGDAPSAGRFEVVSIRPAQVSPEVLASLNSVAGACPLVYAERSETRVHIPLATLCALIRLTYDVEEPSPN